MVRLVGCGIEELVILQRITVGRVGVSRGLAIGKGKLNQ